MELLFQFLSWLARVGVVTAVIFLLQRIAVVTQYYHGISISICFALAIGVVAVYSLLLYPLIDPLRKHPLIDISDIRVLLPVTDGPRGESALKWTKQFPDEDMVRIRVRRGTSALMAVSPAALRDLMATNESDFVKPTSGRNFFSRILGYGLVLSEGAAHTRQRKQLTSSFRVQNIRALHQLMLLKTEILIQNIGKQSDQQPERGVEINMWASRVTLDIIGSALMSKEFNALSGETQPLSDAFSRVTASSPGMTLHFMLGFVLPKWLVAALPTATNKTIRDNMQIVRQSCEAGLAEAYEKIKGREKGSAEDDDILASIITDPGASRTEVIDQMITFLGAGHETTATSIAWVTHLLTLPENKRYQDELRAELLANPDAPASPLALEALPWLNAICEETLRLFPPVTNTARKAVRDTTLAGTRVPRNTLVVLFPWAVNRNPKFWGGAEAEKFRPERWIDTRADGSRYVNGNGGAESNYCNITFLHGNRSCIGKGFAKAELRLIIAKLFGSFRVSRLPGDDGQVTPAGSVTIKPKGGLYVTLERVQ